MDPIKAGDEAVRKGINPEMHKVFEEFEKKRQSKNTIGHINSDEGFDILWDETKDRLNTDIKDGVKIALNEHKERNSTKKVSSNDLLGVGSVGSDGNDTNNTNNTNNTNIPTNLINYYNSKENKYKIAACLFPEKKLTYKTISEQSNVKYDVVQITISRHEELFDKCSVDGNCIISLKPTFRLELETEFNAYEMEQSEAKEKIKTLKLQKIDEDNLLKQMAAFLDYNKDVMLQIAQNRSVIVVDLKQLLEFDATLLSELLDKEFSKFDLAFRNILERSHKKASVQYINMPESQRISLNTIRAENLNKFISTRGQIKAMSAIKNRIISIKFECPSCGHIIDLLQTNDERVIEPGQCGCGRKGRFNILSRECEDYLVLEVETLTEDLLFNEQPRKISVILRNVLLAPESISQISCGSRIALNGLVTSKSDNKIIRDFIIELNSFEPLDEKVNLMQPTEEEQEQIYQIAKSDNPLDGIKPIFNTIYGHDLAKELLILQQFSGFNNGERQGFHLLLIGDPGTGKTQLADTMQKYSPRSKRCSGSGSSGVGLTASVRKNEVVGDFLAEAGVLPQCNLGTAYIDEFDKINLDDLRQLHDALETQMVVLDKANIHARFVCDTKVCATANPKGEIFDSYTESRKQLEETLPAAILDRFDFIIICRDEISQDNDLAIANKILSRSNNKDQNLSASIIKKYICHANTLNPTIPEDIAKELSQFYVKIRSIEQTISKPTKNTTPRSLLAIKRLSLAIARMRLNKIVKHDDVRKAMELYKKIYGIEHL